MTVIFLFISCVVCAQTVAFVDMDRLLENIPEYANSLDEIDRQISSYQLVIDSLRRDIEEKQHVLDVERFLLTEESIRKRQQEIRQMSLHKDRIQRQYFGVDGFVYRSRKRWIQPYLDKIYKAIQEYALQNKIDIIFDKKENNNVIFASPVLDITENILSTM